MVSGVPGSPSGAIRASAEMLAGACSTSQAAGGTTPKATLPTQKQNPAIKQCTLMGASPFDDKDAGSPRVLTAASTRPRVAPTFAEVSIGRWEGGFAMKTLARIAALLLAVGINSIAARTD